MPNNRGTWTNKADFVLALISYGVGLGNVWRFPYLAYSSGGGAFLIPFLVSSVVVGIPYALLEVSLGQWMKEGGIGAWDITPVFKGIGFANLIIVFFGNVYYEVILAWSLRYLFDSFSYDLPWKYCNNAWNSECCSERLLYGARYNATFNNNTMGNITKNEPYLLYANLSSIQLTCPKLVDPITEYWE
jgi:SNF family Na+-dependent transporter